MTVKIIIITFFNIPRLIKFSPNKTGFFYDCPGLPVKHAGALSGRIGVGRGHIRARECPKNEQYRNIRTLA